jgi:uncharacterized protein YjbI with pentapeptide repeats
MKLLVENFRKFIKENMFSAKNLLLSKLPPEDTNERKALDLFVKGITALPYGDAGIVGQGLELIRTLDPSLLSGANFAGIPSPPKGTDFSDLDLSEAVFQWGSPMAVVPQDEAFSVAGGVRGVGNFEKCIFRNCNLSGAKFKQRSTFDRTDFSNANLAGAEINGSNFVVVNFTGCDLSVLARFDPADKNIQFANFTNANLQGMDLSEFVAASSTFTGANLQGVNLRHAALDGCEFQGVDLSTVMNLEEASMDGAEYDDNTKFPPGFDPAANGMVKQ